MKKIICENYKKDKVVFTNDFPFYLLSCDGIHEVSGTIEGTKSAFNVGETYLGTSVNKRNIIITGFFTDTYVERKKVLYDIFPLDTDGTFYYYKNNEGRKISYKVESIDISQKGMYKVFQISLICPNPYFTDIEETVLHMATWVGTFKFPLIIPKDGMIFGYKNNTRMCVINNISNIESGITMEFKANDVVKNPYVLNVNTREKMQINATLKVGEKIIVTTHRGRKDITYFAADGLKEENINYLMNYGSKFLQAHLGNNTYRSGAEAGEENLETVIRYLAEYEAVYL